ncbi:MAG: hypothetical protein KatS3mg057_1235 [Herpetosiphonaceae bacterium]|nr:MAG: hypothetical protein KatS3mg057_1235 [Herpetosiphonaceae bacterium]
MLPLRRGWIHGRRLRSLQFSMVALLVAGCTIGLAQAQTEEHETKQVAIQLIEEYGPQMRQLVTDGYYFRQGEHLQLPLLSVPLILLGGINAGMWLLRGFKQIRRML